MAASSVKALVLLSYTVDYLLRLDCKTINKYNFFWPVAKLTVIFSVYELSFLLTVFRILTFVSTLSWRICVRCL